MAEAGILRKTETEPQLPSYTSRSHHSLFTRRLSLFATITEILLLPSTMGMSDASVPMLTSEEREGQSLQTSVAQPHSSPITGWHTQATQGQRPSTHRAPATSTTCLLPSLRIDVLFPWSILRRLSWHPRVSPNPASSPEHGRWD